MTRREFPGGTYAEILTDGAFAVLMPDRIETHLGPVALPAPGSFPLYLRITTQQGFQVAGQASDRAGTWHYRHGQGWTLDPRIAHGTSGCIFDHAGNLQIIEPAPHQTSQGYRYVEEGTGRLVRGDATYSDGEMRISEWTRHGSVVIGQGWQGGCLAISPHGRRMLEPGHTTFVRFDRAATALAVAIVKFQAGPAAVLLHLTEDELTAFPLETDPQPEPQPQPEPTPKPEPSPVSTPNRSDAVERVAQRFPHLLTTNTYQSCGEFVQRVLADINEPAVWGHVGKDPGERGAVLSGVRVSHDVIWHRPSNRQVDILANAAARSDERPEIWGDARLVWDEVDREHYRSNNPWTPPVPVNGADPTPEPVPGPNPKPQPQPQPSAYAVDLGSLLRPLVARLDALEGKVKELEARPTGGGSVALPGKVALRSAHGRYLVAEGDYTVTADRDGRGEWETWDLEVVG